MRFPLHNEITLIDKFDGLIYFRKDLSILSVPFSEKEISLEEMGIRFEIVDFIKWAKNKIENFKNLNFTLITKNWNNEIIDELGINSIICTSKHEKNYKRFYKEKNILKENKISDAVEIFKFYMNGKDNNIFSKPKIIIPYKYRMTLEFMIEVLEHTTSIQNQYVIYDHNFSDNSLFIYKLISKYRNFNILWCGENITVIEILKGVEK